MKFRLLLLGIILLLLFQNCVLSGNSFQFTSFAQGEKASDGGGIGGNGTGFEGKPEGTFVRLLPENTCSPLSPAPVETLVLDELGAHLKVVDESCVINNFELAPEDVRYSHYQRYFVSVRDGVYVNADEMARTGHSPAVAWCRSARTEREFALTTKQVIWFKGALEARDPVATMVMENHILSASAPGWSFKIDARAAAGLNQGAAGALDLGAFAAQMDLAPDGYTGDQFACHLAYSYDGRIWPARLVLPNKLSGFAKDSTSNNLYLVGRSGTDGVIWSYADAHSASPLEIYRHADMVFDQLQVSPLGGALAVGTRQTLSVPAMLYHFDLASGSLKLLTSTIGRVEQGIAPEFRFSESGLGVFYRDGSQFQNFNRDEKYLMYAPLAGGTPQPVHGLFSADVQPTAIWPLPGGGERVLAAVGFTTSFDFWILAPGQSPVALGVRSQLPVGENIDFMNLQSVKPDPLLLPSGRGFFFKTVTSQSAAKALYYFDLEQRILKPIYQGSSLIAMSQLEEVLVRHDDRIALLDASLKLVREWPEALAAQFEPAGDAVVVLSQAAKTLTLARFDARSGQETRLGEISKAGLSDAPLRGGKLDFFEPGMYLFLADHNVDYKDELYLLSTKNTSITMINDRYDRYLGVLGYVASPATRTVYIRQGAPGQFHLFKYEIPR